ncbi:MAG TPA: chromate transporter [Candidatus Dormibacteraeota bacterium]|nr:chromate transporter [Candidatus Dormibacteraeota bacterium]
MIGSLWTIALQFFLLSLIAVGGANAMLPQLHADAVVRLGWLDDRTFGQMVAITQITPGPNLIIVPLLGWRVDGWVGATVALAAFLTPSTTIAIFAERAMRAHGERPVIMLLRRVLRPVTVGLFLASGIVLARSSGGGNWLSFAIAGGVCVLASTLEINPLWWLGLAAVIGLVVR